MSTPHVGTENARDHSLQNFIVHYQGVKTTLFIIASWAVHKNAI